MPRKYLRRKPKRQYKKKRSITSVVNKILAKKAETKYFNYVEGITTDYNGAVRRITNIAQGLADYNRVGDQLTMSSITLRIALTNESDVYNNCRLIIFRWNDDDSTAAPVPGTLLTDVGYTSAPISPWVFDNMRSGKFKVLYDKLFDVNAELSTAVRFPLKVHLKVKNNIKFVGGSANGIGHIYYLIVSDSSTSTHPIFNVAAQMFFKDM